MANGEIFGPIAANTVCVTIQAWMANGKLQAAGQESANVLLPGSQHLLSNAILSATPGIGENRSAIRPVQIPLAVAGAFSGTRVAESCPIIRPV
jgi:hypothetical protein